MTQSLLNAIDALKRDIGAYVRNVEEDLNAKARGEVAHMLQWVAEHSPQYTGDFAANWKIRVNGVEAPFTPHVFFRKGARNPVSQGDTPAIEYAVAAGAPLIEKITIHDTVTIENPAHRMEYNYAWAIENGKIHHRPENYEGGRVIARYLAAFKGGAAAQTPPAAQTSSTFSGLSTFRGFPV
jgi:hypothetical protein